MKNENEPITAEVIEVVEDPTHRNAKSKKKAHLKDELIVIELPPIPKDVCRVVDPVVENDLSLALVSTFCCWLPLGCLPSIIGCIGIYYAVKAKNAKNETQKKIFSEKSQNLSWLGILIFTGLLIIVIFVMAISGIL